MTAALVPLPVMLPLIGAGLALILGRSARAQRLVSIAVLSAVVALAVVFVIAADQQGPQTVWIGGWNELGIALVADRLSSLMLLVSSIVSLGVLVFSLGQGVATSQDRAPLSIYYPTYLVLSAGVANAFLAGDLFNLFVGFEILLVASYVLLTLGGTGERVRAGSVYVIVSLLSSMLFLISVAMIYAATGTVNFAQLSGRLAELSPGVALVLQFLLLITFAIKAAVFPLSAWLPDSYPTAPAPVTAVFAGLLTKVGVYSIIRMQTLLFPERPLTDLLLWVSVAAMVVGILGAVAQSDLKRMLSFTLISHIGYMTFGVGLATKAGFSGAIFYVVHHIAIQSVLFLVTGLVERRGGSTSLTSLGGLARVAPGLAVLFFVPAMNLAGIPPFSGFIGKTALLSAGVAEGTVAAYAGVIAGVVTSLLTLYAMAKVWNRAFWRSPSEALERVEADRDPDQRAPLLAQDGSTTKVVALAQQPDAEGNEILTDPDHPDALPATMVGATIGLAAAGVALTFIAGPLIAYTDRAAEDLMDRGPYIESVISELSPYVDPADRGEAP